jgi:anti-sigma regulatory factor (Ser/Thr protein kinase)
LIAPLDLSLASEPSAPSRARTAIRQVTGARLPEDQSEIAILLTSELVTNAVIHPHQPVDATIALRITSSKDRLRVEVTDAGAGFAVPIAAVRQPQVGGHGLLLVDRLASRWGTTRQADGEQQRFCVWFELEHAAPLRLT